MPAVDELPHFKAFCRDGSCWMLPLADFERFDAAWGKGEAFWRGRDLYGERTHIRLGDITGLSEFTQTKIARIAEAEHDARKRDLLEGE